MEEMSPLPHGLQKEISSRDPTPASHGARADDRRPRPSTAVYPLLLPHPSVSGFDIVTQPDNQSLYDIDRMCNESSGPSSTRMGGSR